MDASKKWYTEVLLDRVTENLKKRGFDAFWCNTIEEAKGRLLKVIPSDAKVGIGGSISIRELGIIEELENRGNVVIHHWKTGLTPEEDFRIRREEITSDIFLASTNALTVDGIIVNTDGVGNRVAGMIFGSKHVILVVGINKIVKDIEGAIWRIKNVATPMNAHRLGLNTPCAKVGYCINCSSSVSICRVTTIIEYRPSRTDFTVVLVNKELGY
ncbi:MAG: lactate utilization protein [bacterium]|nr:lactate utilization protein [bacterium]